MTLIVTAHIGAILALLAPAPIHDILAPDTPLSVFDVVIPPPPASPPQPSPRPSDAAAVSRSAGGSPRQRQQRPTPTVANPDVARVRPDATITAETLPLPPSGHVVDAVGIDLGVNAGSDIGSTDGNGHGTGTGTGRGAGAGSGDDDGGVKYHRARWLAKPKDADFDQVWPVKQVDGKNVRQNGWAYLACRVKPDGQPHDCQTLYEKPAAIGMGAAAISVAMRSRVRPVFRNGGALLDLRVLIPIIFGHERITVPRVSAEASVPRAR